MLRLPPFRLLRPTSLAEAATMLDGEGPDCRPVAGGTDLWPNMKRRQQLAGTVVSLMGVEELRGIGNGHSGGELRLGATTTLSDLARHPSVRGRYPTLARAVTSISSPTLRNQGTLGGNLCLDTRCTYYNQSESWRQAVDFCKKEAGDLCWLAPGSPRCWAHTAGDSVPVLQALGAEVRLVAADGDRVVPIADLYRDDGIDYLRKRRRELVADVRLPPAGDAASCHSAFWKLRRRGAIDFAVLSAAVALWTEGGVVCRARVVLGSVASAPLAIDGAARALVGRPLGDQDAIAAAAQAARKAARPMDNTDFKAPWRGKMAAAYTAAALREAAGLEPGIKAPR